MANKHQLDTYDVVVVGAGLVGLAAVIALHAEGKRVALIDAKSSRVKNLRNEWDTRIYALTPATEAWLKTLGVWPLVHAARVNDVEAMALWHQASSDALTLNAEDARIDKLACIIENQNLMQALWQKIDTLDVAIMVGSSCQDIIEADDAIEISLESGKQISAALLIAADGAHSFVRQRLGVSTKVKPFHQKAIVANYQAEKGHSNIARQWFAPHSTLALLPLPDDHVSMVWSLSTDLADELLTLTGEQLSQRVQVQSKEVLGHLRPVSEAPYFVLKQVTVSEMVMERVAFIGDAAHQVHPMAGQGANLGFRDVMALQAIIAASHHLQDIGEKSFLRQFERTRKADMVSMNVLTTGLDDLFAHDSRQVQQLTDWGMQQLNKHSSIKSILIKQAVR